MSGSASTRSRSARPGASWPTPTTSTGRSGCPRSSSPRWIRTRVDERRLDQLLDQLRQAPVDQALLQPLRERIVEGSDDQLLRIRPYALADTWGADRRD